MAKSKETQQVPENTEGDTGELTIEGIDALLDDSDIGDEQEAIAPTEDETPPIEAAEGTETKTPGEVEAEAPAPDEGEAKSDDETSPGDQVEEPPVVEPQADGVTPPAEVEEETLVAQEPMTAEQWNEWRSGSIDRLAERYTLTEEEAAAMQENPAEAMPRLAAKVAFDVTQLTTQAIMSHLPQAVLQVQQSNLAATQAEEQFFAAWGDLDAKDPTHRSTVQKLAATYRQAYPKATAEDVITHVGAQAVVALKITPSNLQGTDETPAATTPPPAPAAAKGGSGPVTEVKSKNPFERMASEMLEEDVDDFG